MHIVPTPHPRSALFGDTGPAGETIASIYGAERLQHLRRVTEMYPEQITSENIEEDMADCDLCSPGALTKFKALEAVSC